MGKVVELIDTSGFEKVADSVNRYLEKEAHQTEQLKSSSGFKLVWLARKYDDWFLDPMVGFIVPGIGDVISSAATLPAVYIAMFKIRSFKLTYVILLAMITDLLVGCIPVAGDVADCFYKSSKIASRLIVGTIDNDPETAHEINKRATWGTISIIAVGVAIWLLYSGLIAIYHWLSNLF